MLLHTHRQTHRTVRCHIAPAALASSVAHVSARYTSSSSASAAAPANVPVGGPKELWMVDLGPTGYDACHALQQRIFNAKTAPLRAARMQRRQPTEAEHLPDVVLLTEHAHGVYTMGRRDTGDGFKSDGAAAEKSASPPSSNLRGAMRRASDSPLKARDAAEALGQLWQPTTEAQGSFATAARPCVRQISRGGGLTWHGPGQATVYPIVAFRQMWLRQPSEMRGASPLHWVTEALERAMVTSVRELTAPASVEAYRGKVGVWVPVPRDIAADGEAKIGFVGLAASEYVSMHGCSLNVSCDLSAFSNIIMCELPDKVPTSILACSRPRNGDPRESGAEVKTAAEAARRIGTNFVDEVTRHADASSPASSHRRPAVRTFDTVEEALEAILNRFPTPLQ